MSQDNAATLKSSLLDAERREELLRIKSAAEQARARLRYALACLDEAEETDATGIAIARAEDAMKCGVAAATDLSLAMKRTRSSAALREAFTLIDDECLS